MSAARSIVGLGLSIETEGVSTNVVFLFYFCVYLSEFFIHSFIHSFIYIGNRAIC